MSRLDELAAERERLSDLVHAMRTLGVRRYRDPDGLEIELVEPATSAAEQGRQVYNMTTTSHT
jgi:hypothetical protein